LRFVIVYVRSSITRRLVSAVWAKVVVTGAAGFIGGHLCTRLLDSGVEQVVGVDSLRSGDWTRTPVDVVRDERDISDISVEEWSDILDGADVLFHLAAEKYNSSKSSPDKLMRANVFATEHLFRAAALVGVRRAVFTSSLYAYGSMGRESMVESQLPSPTTLYGASKLMGEHILQSLDREIGLSWNAARLFFIYGPHQHAEGGYKSVILTNFERVLRGESPVIYGDGQQSLDYVYIDDCVDALIELGKSGKDRAVVNVSTGSATTIKELTEMMMRITGAALDPTYADADWTAGSRRCGDTQKMAQVFGWAARTPMSDGLQRVYDWLIQRG
jgi:UDP-glucose 4-epimerase